MVFFSLLFCLVLTQLAAGQTVAYASGNATGEIAGRVFDMETGQGLANVNVLLVGTQIGDASAQDGSFQIAAVPPGDYSLELSCIGYERQLVESVVVLAGKKTMRNILLEQTYLMLSNVVLTASKSEQTVHLAPASVSMVKAGELRDRDVRTFDEALELVPGLNLQRTMGVSVQSLSLRGSSEVAGGGVGNRVLLAIDGRPALSSDSGGALWSLVPTNFIDRIEIVKGAFSSLYGSTAMGGVINVITRKPAAGQHFHVDASLGMHERAPKEIRVRGKPGAFHTVDLSHSRNFGNFSYLFSLSRKASEGHRQRSAYEFYNLYGKVYFNHSDNRNFEFTIGSDIGRNDYPHTWFSNTQPLRVALKNTDNEQRKHTFSADAYYYAIPNARVKYSTRFYFYRQYFSSKFNEDDPLQQVPNNEPFGLTTRSDSRKLGSITQLDYYMSDRNHLIAGLDIQRDLVDAQPDTILYGKHQVNNFALYMQDEYYFNARLTASIGLRFDLNKLVDGNTLKQFSPKISLVYSPVSRLALRFLAGRAFRAPSIAERFFQREIAGGTRFRPNPNLEAESVVSLEVGSRFSFGNTIELDVALFRNRYADMLYWVNIGPELGLQEILFEVRNLNDARIQGIENSITWHLVDALDLRLNYTYLDAKDQSNNRTDDELAYKIRHTFNLNATLKLHPWMFHVDGRYNSAVDEVFLYPNDKPDAFFVMNAKLRRNFGDNFAGRMGVNNLFDLQYEEMARYRLAGRTWVLGLSYEMH